MTTTSLDAALTGMLEQQRNMELISNNIANVNTTGYKRAKVHFQDLLDTAQILAYVEGTLTDDTAVSTASGVTTADVQRIFEQGPLSESASPFDLAIVGSGLFRVRLVDDTIAYTRDGSLRLDGARQLVTSDGTPLDPPVIFPQGFTNPRIRGDGTVVVKRPLTEQELAALAPGDKDDSVDEVVGQLTLSRFDRSEALASIGSSLYVATEDAGEPIDGAPGSNGLGRVVSGFLENSNVSVAEELTALIVASRAYQMNLMAYRTIREMLEAANELVI
jgi:flagellar basal-body rod protein FlgG